MSKAIFAVCLAFAVAVLVSKDAMSAPQFSSSFGSGNGTSISSGGLSNSSSNVPGSGYGGEYYSNHQNETAPTSPSLNGGSISSAQNNSMPANTCDCNNVQNVQEMAPTNAAPSESPAGADPAGGNTANSGSGSSSGSGSPVDKADPSDLTDVASGFGKARKSRN